MIRIRYIGSRFRKDRKAASPAISMAILTGVTIILVLVASNYAYSALEQQQGQAEYQSVQKSFLTYDDAIRDVAWNKGSYRTARFTCKYGFLEVSPDVSVNINIAEFPNANYSGSTSYLRYNLSTSYLTFGEGYEHYVFGNQSTLITSSVEDLGQLVIRQDSEWINTCLSYRVRILRETSMSGVTYVNLLITKLTASEWSTYSGDIDLTAKNTDITAISYGPYELGYYTLNVNFSGLPNAVPEQIQLNIPGEVVFNFVVSTVKVTV